MHKPVDEYYLHDHGDGNGWQVVSKGPGRFGVITTGSVNNHEGVIELCIEQYLHGGLSSTNTTYHMLSPEEALDLGNQLVQAAEEGEGIALETRKNKYQTKLQI